MSTPPVIVGLLFLLGLVIWLSGFWRQSKTQHGLATVTDLYVVPGKQVLIPQTEGADMTSNWDKRLVRLKLRQSGQTVLAQVGAILFRELTIGAVVQVEFHETPWGKQVTRVKL